ncbi:MAG: hypothetical protein LPK13_06000 [Marinobacter sp.]|uniref:hypothetical protein n=1 Tax=Marinobacter sp. TaxID=50741 RepID=UPI0029C3EF4C|nr:hypothetical protein [Marinobacter sp.]MDX5335625.1 hypothetical protein [Marinobacter sp.]MDX5386513.1 hypothetical protein [Marinobacter sp.]MDX5471970.1 hypothetical protein [Marinobacter sp.]
MKNKVLFVVIMTAVLVSGCATPLTSGQKQELQAYKAKGLAVEEKNPGAGAALGILPGGGSFYAREYGLGVVNLLFWPASILWDPMSGYQGSESINYYATQEKVSKLKSKEINQLDDQLMMGTIDNKKYVADKRKIEEKYSTY